MRSQAGVTLIETLVAAALTIVVFGSVLTVLDVFQRDNRYDTLRAEAQDNARNTLDALARELRNGAAPSSLTPGALERAEPYEVVFQTIESHSLPAGKNVTNAIRVRYYLRDKKPKNEVLFRQTQKWTEEETAPKLTTCPAEEACAGFETPHQVVKYIVNRNGGRENLPLFKYVPAGAGVGEITGVEPDIYINVNPTEKFPGETELTTAIDLRNENRPPLASFSAKEVGSRIVELNGSQSTDPDGLALSYAWSDNGTAIAGRSSLIDTGAETVGTHVFKLTVTTPSGLEATAEKELKVT